MSTKRIKKQVARTPLKRATPATEFAPRNLRGLLPRYRGRTDDVMNEMVADLPCCTLCGGESFRYMTRWTTPEERTRWGADWLGFCLCRACFATPEVSQQRLEARFRYFLDPPEGSLLSWMANSPTSTEKPAQQGARFW